MCSEPFFFKLDLMNGVGGDDERPLRSISLLFSENFDIVLLVDPEWLELK